MGREEADRDVRIVGLARGGVAVDPGRDDRYRYTFALAPPPDGHWCALLLEICGDLRAAGDVAPPCVEALAPGRLTATFVAAADGLLLPVRLTALVARANAAHRARYPAGAPEDARERAWRRAQAARLRPARAFARALRF